MRVEQERAYRNMLEKDVLLQTQLQGETNDLVAIRDARVSIGQLVSQYIKTIDVSLKRIPEGSGVKGEVEMQGKLLTKKINQLLDQVLQHMKTERTEAIKQMDTLKKTMKLEKRREAKHKEEFDTYLKDEGEDPEDWKEPYEDEEAEDDDIQQLEEEQEHEEVESMRKRVDNFFHSVEGAKAMQLKSDSDLEAFEKYMAETVVPTLESEDITDAGEKKAEMDLKMVEMMKAAGLEAVSPQQALDRFSSVIDATKGLKKIEVFNDMHRRYAANETDAHGIVAELEALAEGEEYIPIEWLWDADAMDNDEYDEHLDEDTVGHDDDGHDDDGHVDDGHDGQGEEGHEEDHDLADQPSV